MLGGVLSVLVPILDLGFPPRGAEERCKIAPSRVCEGLWYQGWDVEMGSTREGPPYRVLGVGGVWCCWLLSPVAELSQLWCWCARNVLPP